jgi:hypothetical protein
VIEVVGLGDQPLPDRTRSAALNLAVFMNMTTEFMLWLFTWLGALSFTLLAERLLGSAVA